MVTAELRDVNHFMGKVHRNATANQIRAFTTNSSMVTAELRDVNHSTGKVPRNATANQIRAFTINSSMVTAELRDVNHYTGKFPGMQQPIKLELLSPIVAWSRLN